MRQVAFLTALISLAGCFGEGDGQPQVRATPIPPVTGIFVDSPVDGAEWETSGGASGLTNEQGEFSYVPGEQVSFSVGSILLGSAPGAPVITAVELTGSNNPNDTAAVNLLVFLQSIDADQDPGNGITITAATRAAAVGQSLDFSAPDFATAVQAVVASIAPGNTVVSAIDALAHFYTTFTALGGTDTFSFSFPGFPPTRSGVTYELVFADEFDTGDAPDPETWNYDIGYGPDSFGWGNNEWQLYTDSPDNVRVEDGNLVIQARCDTPPCGVRDGSVTSARINTRDKFEFRYGTIIARIKPPVGDGAWPAFWSLGANHPEIGWPRSGEIDFMEMHNAFSNDRTTHFTMHWCDETVNPSLQPTDLCFPQDQGWVFFTQNREFPQSLGDDFHLFEADWDQNRIIGRIDGITYFERTIEPGTMEEFLREFFLILNVAMGGTLGSDQQPPTGNETWPQTMLVDYVRVFQRSDAPTQELFIDFEGAPGSYVFNNFEGGVGSVISNPQSQGINTSAQVAQVRKFNGAVFAGTTLATAFDVPANSSFTMKIWSPRQVNVLFKLEGIAGAETEATHSGNGWEELSFDLGGFSGTANGITFIFDNGTPGNAADDPGNWTFYVDDILRLQLLSQIDLPITFDAATVDYTLTDFGDPVAAATVLVEDPEDAANTVASTTKPGGAPVWAGTTMSTPAGLASPIPFTANDTTIGVRVYSPAAGIPVRLKADNMVGGAISVETEVSTTVANEWETLVFDFSNQVDGTAPLDPAAVYRVLSIFFDFGSEGNDATYLWDDVEFGVPLPDTTPPALVSVSLASSNANAGLATTGDTVTITLVADEAIVAPTVTVNGVAAGEISGGGANWEASRILDATDVDGPVTFAIDFADIAGNAGATVSSSTDGSAVTLDATAPTLAIVGAPVGFTTLDPIPLTFQFSEAVSGFTSADIVVSGGSKSGFATVNASTYTASFTPNGTGNLSVGVMAAAAIDAAGNASEAATGIVITNNLDADAPLLTEVTLVSSNANAGYARSGDLVTVSMIANEEINEPSVTIAGIAADTVSGSGSSWTASRTMQATDPEGEIGFVINFEDVGGNAGPQTTATTDGSAVIFDITAPTVAITGLPATVQTLDPVLVTFQFNEQVSGFTIEDINVSNGTADGFVSVDAATYNANVTAQGAGDLTVSVSGSAATDLAGNDNAAASVTVSVDLQPFWQQVWADEFTGTALNISNWTKRTDADCPDPCPGIQSYLAERVSVGAGLLTIQSQQSNNAFSSGLIDTRGKREFRFGRVEIDAKLPPGTAGLAPALLLLPATGEYGTWPLSGEIDITNAPGLGDTLEHSLHYGLPEPENTTATATSVAPVDSATQFLSYALEWEGGEIRWFVDGAHVATQVQDNWYTYTEDADGVLVVPPGAAPFDQDFYLVLSQAVEASGGVYPQNLQVTAVRVYQCANAVDPEAGTGCAGTVDPVDPMVVPVVATAPPYNDQPYVETLDAYVDAPATLDFVDENNMTMAGTLVPGTFNDPGVSVLSNTSATDGANSIWNVDIDATAGTGGVVMGPADFSPANGSFDLSGGATAGEVLFRMRVNSSLSDPQLAVGLDSDTGSGSVALEGLVADGTWRNYSIKLADLVTDSVLQGTPLDLAGLQNLFRLQASGGAVNLDVDDLAVKVACRDTGLCEATPRVSSAPPETVYEQDFELPDIDINDTQALTDDGWFIFGNVFNQSGGYLFGYGVFGAPNDPPPNGNSFFSAIVSGQGGPSQGDQQLSIFNDYNCCQPSNGHFNGTDLVESLVFQERTITNDDVGRTYTFSFDAKADTSDSGVGGSTVAIASLKTLDPNAGFAQTNLVTVDTTNLPDTWQRYEISLEIDPGLVGQLFQFGFSSTASNFEPSNVFYDNVLLTRTAQ